MWHPLISKRLSNYDTLNKLPTPKDVTLIIDQDQAFDQLPFLTG
jgi:hypothetical protein